MALLSHISRKRQSKRRTSTSLRTSLGCTGFLTVVLVTSLFLAAGIYAGIVKDLPAPEALPALLEPPAGLLLQPTRLYDSSGEHLLLSLEYPAAEGHQYLTMNSDQSNSLPEILVQATLAAEQPDFWTSPGFSFSNLEGDEHPTLAQRLVYEFLLQSEAPGITRALRERLLAAQLTSHYGREKILEWYLNSTTYGAMVFGADAAARVYFGKPATQITLAQAAALVAISESVAGTGEVNPVTIAPSLLERQQEIIQAMLGTGMITTDQARQALEQKIAINNPIMPESLSPAFNQLVLEQAHLSLPGIVPERGGLRIITTLDYDLQLQADCVTTTQLARLAGINQEAFDRLGQPCLAARLLPTLSLNPTQTDRVGSLVIMDPTNGQIQAMVGSTIPGLNPTLNPGRPGGTLLTPLIYLAAFTRGFSPASMVWDIPDSTTSTENANDLSTGDFHGPVRLRTAMANDYLGPAGQLLTRLGRDSAIRTSEQLGLSRDPNRFTSAIDSGPISLLDVTHLYATLANQGSSAGQSFETNKIGESLQPVALLRVERTDGQVLVDWSAGQTRPVVSAQLAYLINNVLSDEAARWPSLGHPNSLEIGRPAAVKLGRTEDSHDGWTVGYTPRLVAGIWLGTLMDEPDPQLLQSTAAIWHAIMQYASQAMPAESWPVPPGITTVNVCDPSGLLPTRLCPSIVAEVFQDGSVPTYTDTLYRQFQINRETGRLATVFTPSDVVEDRVYLVVPREAVEWARKAGFELPPDTYDVIFPPVQNPEVNISLPALFDQVHGKVFFQGSATGDDFDYYRLQIGQGLNPTSWVQIGVDETQPVENGILGVWDASQASGLYAVELLVVQKDQRFERAITQITVDNQAPEVSFLSPQAGEVMHASSNTAQVFHAQATDDLNLAKVEFYLDGKLISTLTQEPFDLAWKVVKGKHTLKALAFDLAGNTSATTVDFSVK